MRTIVTAPAAFEMAVAVEFAAPEEDVEVDVEFDCAPAAALL